MYEGGGPESACLCTSGFYPASLEGHQKFGSCQRLCVHAERPQRKLMFCLNRRSQRPGMCTVTKRSEGGPKGDGEQHFLHVGLGFVLSWEFMLMIDWQDYSGL